MKLLVGDDDGEISCRAMVKEKLGGGGGEGESGRKWAAWQWWGKLFGVEGLLNCSLSFFLVAVEKW